MNTYNSFNELAAGQAAMASDMSTFNAITGGKVAKLVEQMRSSVASLEQSVKRAWGEDKKIAVLEDFHATWNHMVSVLIVLQKNPDISPKQTEALMNEYHTSATKYQALRSKFGLTT
jgi:hypothetical protein